MDINQELRDLRFRELSVSLETLFPRLDREGVLHRFAYLRDDNDDSHATLFDVANVLGDNGNKEYAELLERNGFHDAAFQRFSGHCHQFTPALGLVLKTLGFDVSYLEGYRVESSVTEGRIVQVNPELEPNPDNRQEFCGIGRIPYCCLEVVIDGEPFHVSPKHLAFEGTTTKALLTPACYRPHIGLMRHQDTPAKSGIYLQTFAPRVNPDRVDFKERVVWMKQKLPEKGKEPETLEFFATYLRMKLA